MQYNMYLMTTNWNFLMNGVQATPPLNVRTADVPAASKGYFRAVIQ